MQEANQLMEHANQLMEEANRIQIWTSIATWLTFLATLSVVVIAAWYKRLIENRRRPVLILEYHPENEGDNKYLSQESTKDNSEEVWIRARVKNISNSIAENVEARLVQIRRENGSWDNRPNWWFKVSNLNMISTSVPPKFTQYIDLAYVKNVVTNSDELCFYLTLTTPHMAEWTDEKNTIESEEETRLYIGGKYTMILALLCSNADAKYYKFELNVLSPSKDDPKTDSEIGQTNLKNRLNVNFLGEVKPEIDF